MHPPHGCLAVAIFEDKGHTTALLLGRLAHETMVLRNGILPIVIVRAHNQPILHRQQPEVTSQPSLRLFPSALPSRSAEDHFVEPRHPLHHVTGIRDRQIVEIIGVERLPILRLTFDEPLSGPDDRERAVDIYDHDLIRRRRSHVLIRFVNFALSSWGAYRFLMNADTSFGS